MDLTFHQYETCLRSSDREEGDLLLVIINSSSPYLIVEPFKVQFKQQVIFHFPWLPIKDISPCFVQPLSAGCALAWPPSRTLSLASLPMSQRSRFFRPQIWFLPGGYLKMEFTLKTHWKTVTTAMRYSTSVIFPSLCQPGGQVESHDAPAGHHTLHLPTHCRLASHIYMLQLIWKVS